MLSAAFAVESFLKLAAHICVQGETASRSVSALALHGFDAVPLMEKLRLVWELTGSPEPLPNNLRKDVTLLAEWRNAAVHETPTVLMEPGAGVQFRGAKLRAKFGDDLDQEGRIPRISDSEFPISLMDALKAVSTHEQIVAYFKANAPAHVAQMFERRVRGGFTGILDFTPAPLPMQLVAIGKEWDRLVREQDAVPSSLIADVLAELGRGSRVKVVPDADV